MTRVRTTHIAAAAALAIVALLVIAGGVRGMAIVEGRSMEPLFHTGDAVLLRSVAPEEIRPGDILVYETPDGRYIIHRVIKVYESRGTYCFIVKGDNNLVPDMGFPPCPPYGGTRGVPYSSVKGVVAEVLGVPVKIPYIGGFTLLIRG